jgi:sugar/nucleoside kinase (ribokinase family)
MAQVPIACIGDLMLEVITMEDIKGTYQRTLIVDGSKASVGGAACNLSWYFSQLGRPSKLISHYGAADRERVKQCMEDAQIDPSSLIERLGMTDLLIVMTRREMPAIYVAGCLRDGDTAAMIGGIRDEGWIVFGGSRHAALRRAFLQRVSACRSANIIFAPSYTLYDYSVEEVKGFLSLSDIVFVNEHEADYLDSALHLGSPEAIMRSARQGGVITRGAHGADLYPATSKCLHVPSVSRRNDDVIGTGEAFLCGFLHSYIADGAWERAGKFGCTVAARVVLDGRVRTPIERLGLSPLR